MTQGSELSPPSVSGDWGGCVGVSDMLGGGHGGARWATSEGKSDQAAPASMPGSIQWFDSKTTLLQEHDRRKDLDVPDLWLDIRRRRWCARAWYCGRNAVGSGSHELDLPRMWRSQRRFRDGSDLTMAFALCCPMVLGGLGKLDPFNFSGAQPP